MVFGLDSEFSEEALVNRINADLANDLGNLVSRSLTMIDKYFMGDLPDPGPSMDVDETLKENALALIEQYGQYMEDLGFHKALMALWDLIGRVNKYIDSMAPWVLAKSDKDRLGTVMFHIFETLKIIAALLWPFMPESSQKLQDQLKLPNRESPKTMDMIRLWGEDKPVGSIKRASALFPRIETEKPIGKEPSKSKKASPKKSKGKKAMQDDKAPERKTDMITFEEFQKIDLRIGTVTHAEAVPGSKKLIKLSVDVGEPRTVVAGILGHYTADELMGKQVVLVSNLKPAKLMGIESQGMVLAAEDQGGVRLLAPDKEMKAGSKVR
jgi:methionyl-tRNA synthetase